MFNKKRIIAIVLFLLLSFFIISFGNPVENEPIATRLVKFIDGYNSSLISEQKVEVGEDAVVPNIPVHKNKVFVGWYDQISTTTKVTDFTNIINDLTVVGKYKDDLNNNQIDDDLEEHYSVKFVDSITDAIIKTQKVLVGLDAAAPSAPIHEGYTFTNWSGSFSNVKKDLTITTEYSINSYNLTINYKYEGSNIDATSSYNGSYVFNASYSVTSPSIVGYTPSVATISGTMIADNVIIDVIYKANSDTLYKVEHYTQNLDDASSYTKVRTDNMSGTTDTLTDAKSSSITGFTAKPFSQVNIAGNGSTIVRIDYTRNSYLLTITYNYSNSDKTSTYTHSYKYGEEYDVDTPVVLGYTPSLTEVKGTMGDGAVNQTVTYSPNANTSYKVEHYTENLDDASSYTLVDTDNMSGTTDTNTVASSKSYSGFTVIPFSQSNINGDGSTVVKIYYARNTYKLTYIVDGVQSNQFEVKFGASITPLVNPTKRGYTFSGWSSIPSTMPNHDVDVTGNFKVNKYCLTIYYQNIYGLPMLSVLPYIGSIDYGTQYNIISPVIAGYTTDKLVVSGTMTDSPLFVTVTYTANTDTPYVIKYYKNGTFFELENKTGTTDSLVTITPDNNRYNGYYFNLFSLNNWLVDTIHGNGSTVFKVNYKTYDYLLKYNANKPSGLVGISLTPFGRSYTVEDSFSITATMSSTSHNFLGWFDNAAGTGSAVTQIVKGTTGNKTLYAKWDIKKYTVTFNAGLHGSLSSTTANNVAYGTTFGNVNKPIVTPNAGYTFSGWNVTNDTVITGAIIATAQYTANTNTGYKVKHYTQNLDNASNYTLVDTDNMSGTTDTNTAASSKSYSGFTVKPFSQTNIAGDGSTVINIYYDRNSYSLTFKPENDTADMVSTVKYGASISAPTVTKTGYTFVSWTPGVPATMPASNATYTATWNINSYKLTINYLYDDDSVAATKYEHTYNYNTPYSVTSPTVAGYTPSIATVTGTIGASDTTITVKYTANSNTQYKVEHYTQNLDDGSSYTKVRTDNMSGTTDTLTDAKSSSITGFTAKPFSQVNIAGNGSTIVRIDYTRNSYLLTITYNYSNSDKTSTYTHSYKYGEEYDVDTPVVLGYTPSLTEVKGTMGDGAVNQTVTYSPNANLLTIHYEYADHTSAHTDFTSSVLTDATYSVTSPSVAGYTPNEATISGTMVAGGYTTIVTYNPNNNTVYKVEHYTQNLDDASSYTKVRTDNMSGTTDTLTDAKSSSITGFTAKPFSQVNIAGNGSTVVRIGYTRNSYLLTITYNYSNSDKTSTYTHSYKYGEEYDVDTPVILGYTPSLTEVKGTMGDGAVNQTVTYSPNANSLTIHYEYTDHTSAHTDFTSSVLTDATYSVTSPSIAGYTPNTPVTTGKMGPLGVTTTVTYTANNNTGYKVECHLQNISDDNYTYDPSHDDNKSGTTNDTTNVIPQTILGFTPKAIEQKVIAGNGSTVVEVYYDRNIHDITYMVDGTSTYKTISDIKYGATVTLESNITKTGYTFSGWTGLISPMPDYNYMINGSFAINSYTLSINYKINGATDSFSSYINSVVYNTPYSVTSPSVAGYTPSKSIVDGTMGASNHSETIVYTANTNTGYKVKHYTQNLDNASNYTLVDTDNMSGTTDTSTAASSKSYSGFTVKPFSQANIAGDGSTVVSIYYDRNSYTLTYKPENDTADMVSTVKYGASISAPTVTKTGYTFASWTPGVPETMPASNATYTATWNINSYKLTINYLYNDDSVAATKYEHTYNYNTPYSVTSPTVAGYTPDEATVTGTIGASDTTITVKYTANSDTLYKVEYYKSNGSTVVLAGSENRNGTTDTTVSVTDADKTLFTGYTFDSTNVSNVLSGTITGAGSLVLKVYYLINDYNVTYNVNAPTGMVGTPSAPSSQNYTIETDTFNVANALSSTSHDFLGWFDNASGTGSVVTQIAKGTTGDKTLYAKWEIKKYTVTFAEGLHGTISSTATNNVAYGTTFNNVTKPNVTPNAGYTFSGWNVTNDTIITGAITATAQYIANANSLTIHYEYTDHTSAHADFTSSVLTDTAYSVASPSVAGYTPDEATISGTMVAGGYTTTVTYTANNNTEYKVEFYKDGVLQSGDTSLRTGTTKSTVTLTTEDKAKYTGYTYTSTGSIESGSIAGDGSLVLKANYTINSYSVTYSVKAIGDTTNVVNPSSLPSTKVFNVLTPTFNVATGLTSDSATFLGWFETVSGAETQVTSIPQGTSRNINLYGKWTKKTFTVNLDPNGGDLPLGTSDQTSKQYGESYTLPSASRNYTLTYSQHSGNSNVTSAATLLGWCAGSTSCTAGELVAASGSTTITSNVKFYAIWGNASSPLTVIAGTDYDVAYERYQFNNWSIDDNTLDYTTTTYATGSQITLKGNTTLVAKYNHLQPIIQVGLSTQVNTSSSSTTAEYGDIITYSITITNTGTYAGTVNIKDILFKDAISSDYVTLATGSATNANSIFSTTGLNGISVDAGETKTYTFTYTVTGNAGTVINTQATYSINGGVVTTTDIKTINIEKTISLISVTNNGANIVLTLDTSGSMGGNKINNMKTAARNFVDSQDLTKSQICLVEFYDDTANTLICSSNASDLKAQINNLVAGGYTPYTRAMNKTMDNISTMTASKPNNKNVVVFLSDGEPNGTGDAQSQYLTVANTLKTTYHTTIYAIGFEVNTAAANRLRAIATTGKYYASTSSEINTVFANISDDIEQSGTVKTVNGLADISSIYSSINASKNIEFFVNNTSIYSNTLANAITDGYITSQKINVSTKFNASDVIKFKYYAN